MANTWCLIKENAEALSKKLKTRELRYIDLKKMGTEKRLETFGKFMSESDAKKVNLLFEKKMVQKDFYKGVEAWRTSLTGEKSAKQAKLKQMISNRKEETLTKVFDPKSDELFLKELASSKVGIDISKEEAKMLFGLSKKMKDGSQVFQKRFIEDKLIESKGIKLSSEESSLVDSILKKIEKEYAKGELTKYLRSSAYKDIQRSMDGKLSDETRTAIKSELDKVIKSLEDGDYGVARQAYEQYIGDIVIQSKKGVGNAVRDLKESVTTSGMKGDIIADFGAVLGRGILELFGAMKSAKGSFDASAIGRQARSVLFSGNFKEWFNIVANNYKILVKSVKEDTLPVIKAQIYNRPNGRAGLYDSMKLAIGGKEEQYASSIVSKLPGFKQSEEMFSGSLWIARAELADKFYQDMVKTYERSGIDITSKSNLEQYNKELVSIGNRVNSMTGRGTKFIGKAGEGTSVVLWSPKLMQATIDQMTGHAFGLGIERGTTQRAAVLKDWLIRLGMTTGALGIASAIYGKDSVEVDPRSSKFGTIKGIDITGGMGGYITFLARLAGKTKNTQTGTFSDTYSSKSFVQVLADFVVNKTSPGTRMIIDYLNGYNFDGESTKITKEALNDPEIAKNTAWVYAKGSVVPIPLARFVDSVRKGNDPMAFFNLALAADLTGFSDKNFVYSPNWNKSEAKQYKKFKEKFGTKTFNKANGEFAVEYAKMVNETVASDEYKKKDNEERKKALEKVKRDATNKIFENYKFDPDE